MEIFSDRGSSSGFKIVNVDKNEIIVGSLSDEVIPNRELTYLTASGQ